VDHNNRANTTCGIETYCKQVSESPPTRSCIDLASLLLTRAKTGHAATFAAKLRECWNVDGTDSCAAFFPVHVIARFEADTGRRRAELEACAETGHAVAAALVGRSSVQAFGSQAVR